MPPVVAIMVLTGMVMQSCAPTPNKGVWHQAWYYDDNRGADAKTDKPRVDPKNNTR